MKKKYLFLGALFFTHTVFAQKKEIDKYLSAQMVENSIQGLAAAVIKDGKVIYTGSFGKANLEAGSPVSSSTAFQIASVTKLFTSTLLLKYVNAGYLSLMDDVSKFIDSCPASWAGMKIYHLASHRSGLSSPDIDNQAFTMETAVKLIKASPLEYPFGTRQRYVLGDYVLLKYILEKIGKDDLGKLYAKEILNPLGMTNTSFNKESKKGVRSYGDIVPGRANIYYVDTISKALRNYSFYYPEITYAAGGLFTSIADLAKWVQAIDQGQLIDKSQLSLLTKVDSLPNGRVSRFNNFGWMVENYQNKYTLIGHSGGPGLGDIIRFPDQKLTIIVLTNSTQVLPFIGKSIATFYLKDLNLPTGPKISKGAAY